jgi:hypothetical protein
MYIQTYERKSLNNAVKNGDPDPDRYSEYEYGSESRCKNFPSMSHKGMTKTPTKMIFFKLSIFFRRGTLPFQKANDTEIKEDLKFFV